MSHDEKHEKHEKLEHPDESDLETLEKSWAEPGGFYGWLTTANHKSIGRRYIITAMVFLLLGGLEAAMMRWQLARPENQMIGPDLYNQLFTMHGTTMMFLFAVPVMNAVGIYLVPMMVGTRNIVFPQLNAFGYWVYLIGGVFLYVGFVLNIGPDTGWFSYVPLAGPEYAPGKRVDVWAQTVTFTEVAALVAAVEIIGTVFKMRAPGMTLSRIPLFVWSQVVVSFMIIFAMPAVATASLALASDRLLATHFFNPAEGGDALLWQHLFWFFGHPEVYIIFLPALGMVSSIVATFSRRPIFGYPAMVAALVAQGFLGFGLWVHHMFATPLPQLGQSFFTAASMLIAIPSAVQIFCWIATVWSGRPRFAAPMLFAVGWIPLFMIGGVTGVMLASIPFDLQAHDTFFVVAHLHYVLLAGAVFPLFGGLYYWFPKITGRMLSDTAGKWHFWLFAIGLNVTFFPMHFLGMLGMPRRVYTYLEETGWGDLNLLSTVGANIIVLSVVLFLVNVVYSLLRGAVAGADPWGGETLEWGTSSPPETYNFRYIPVVEGRSTLWEWNHAGNPVVTGLRSDRREILITSVLDAEPEIRQKLPADSIGPLLSALAVGVTFIGSIFHQWGFVIGMELLSLAVLYWFWPKEKDLGPEAERHGARPRLRKAA